MSSRRDGCFPAGWSNAEGEDCFAHGDRSPGQFALAKMLRSHGKDDLAERAVSLTDDELTRIGTLGAYFAWSDDALALDGRGSMAAPERCRWPRSTCPSARGVTYAVTTPTASLRGDGRGAGHKRAHPRS
jgi:hypothetical protein